MRAAERITKFKTPIMDKANEINSNYFQAMINVMINRSEPGFIAGPPSNEFDFPPLSKGYLQQKKKAKMGNLPAWFYGPPQSDRGTHPRLKTALGNMQDKFTTIFGTPIFTFKREGVLKEGFIETTPKGSNVRVVRHAKGSPLGGRFADYKEALANIKLIISLDAFPNITKAGALAPIQFEKKVFGNSRVFAKLTNAGDPKGRYRNYAFTFGKYWIEWHFKKQIERFVKSDLRF